MFIETFSTDPRLFFAIIITVVVSVCLHELAHGLVAVWLGDDTPIEQGRITLNPLVHMGLISLITLLLVGIAWGAMPVDPRRLRLRYGRALVAVAGPLMNVLLALLALVGLGLWQRFDGGRGPGSQAQANAQFLLWVFGSVNVLLAIFNLIPFPPLDGSRILADFSWTFSNFIDRVVGASPMVYLQVSAIGFMVAGAMLTPVAMRVSQYVLVLARGHQHLIGR